MFMETLNLDIIESMYFQEYRRLNAKNLEGEEKKKACKELMEKVEL